MLKPTKFQPPVRPPVETTARVGQNFFRAAVLMPTTIRFCITGLSFPVFGNEPDMFVFPGHDPATEVNQGMDFCFRIFRPSVYRFININEDRPFEYLLKIP